MLSGTGSDGTLGVRAVKGEGGMVMAQNPESTEYDGMPAPHRHGVGGLRAAARRDAAPAHRLRRPRIRQNAPAGIPPGSQSRRRDEEGLYPTTCPDRP